MRAPRPRSGVAHAPRALRRPDALNGTSGTRTRILPVDSRLLFCSSSGPSRDPPRRDTPVDAIEQWESRVRLPEHRVRAGRRRVASSMLLVSPDHHLSNIGRRRGVLPDADAARRWDAKRPTRARRRWGVCDAPRNREGARYRASPPGSPAPKLSRGCRPCGAAPYSLPSCPSGRANRIAKSRSRLVAPMAWRFVRHSRLAATGRTVPEAARMGAPVGATRRPKPLACVRSSRGCNRVMECRTGRKRELVNSSPARCPETQNRAADDRPRARCAVGVADSRARARTSTREHRDATPRAPSLRASGESVKRQPNPYYGNGVRHSRRHETMSYRGPVRPSVRPLGAPNVA